MKFNELNSEEERVIIHKGTEQPFSGEFYKNDKIGTYLCKRCDAPLFKSEDKFDSNCGWPSFDDEIEG
ncbi:MAG: methionine sulfoxide reductase, partial [Candidatus Cloacimonetes bacterium]|nr:methionine sulfoxide reductase [Candidatus Cloacimonadota bacterium]